MGARAYATGNQVAFAASPDLHLAAHEAAHVVQQRGGIQLSGGVGAVGDVYEQHADSVADLVVQGKSAEGLLDVHAPSGGRSASVQRAIQRDETAPAAAPAAAPATPAARRARADAERLRRRLEERSRELEDPVHVHGRETEVRQIAMALAELAAAGDHPTSRLVARLTHEHLARVDTTHRAEARPMLEATLADAARGPAPPPEDDRVLAPGETLDVDGAVDRARSRVAASRLDALPAGAPDSDVRAIGRDLATRRGTRTEGPVAPSAASVASARELRETLRRRLSTPVEADATEPATIRRARAALDALGDSPTSDAVMRVAAAAGVHDGWTNDTPYVVPIAATPTRPAAGTAVTASLTGGSVTTTDEHGEIDGHGVSLSATGGTYTHTTGHHGAEASTSVGGTLVMGSDGPIGADLSLGGAADDTTTSVTIGETAVADRPQLQRDGRYRVSWRYESRRGGSGEHETSGVGAELGASGRLTHAGADYFSSIEEANAFRAGFRARVMIGAGPGREGADFWQSAPVGTERGLTGATSITPGLSMTLGGILRIGLEVELSGSVALRASKHTETHATVTEVVHVAAEGEGTIGAAGIRVGTTSEAARTVTLTFEVELASGAFSRLVNAHIPVTGIEDGVRQTGHETEVEATEGEAVRAGFIASLGGTSGTATRTATEYNAEGHGEEVVTERASQDFTGTTVTGAYSRRHLSLDAGTDEAHGYRATTDFHTTSGSESARELADDTHTTGMDPDAASSGHWAVSESLTQAQMRAFHVAFLREEAHGLGAYRTLHGALARIPTDASGDAARARAIAAFVAAEGRRGLTIIEGLAHADPDRWVRLYTADGVDQNIMGEHETREMETHITEYRAAIADHHIDGLEARITVDVQTMSVRLAAIRNMDSYTDLPRELRAQMVQRYQGLLSQLQGAIEAVHGDADVTTASALSNDAQAEFRALEDLRTRATAARTLATGAHDDLARHRAYYGLGGLGSSHAEHSTVPLDPRVASETEALWSAGGLLFEQAGTNLTEAEDRLAPTRGSEDELTVRAAYRTATALLQTALADYPQAQRDYSRANLMFQALEIEPHGAAPRPVVPAPTAVTREHATGRTARATPEAPPAIEELYAEAISNAELATHVHFDEDHDVTSDRGSIRMPSGLVVEILAATHRGVEVLAVNPALLAALGDRRVYELRLRVVTPVPGFRRFSCHGASGALVDVDNRVGVAFTVVAAL